eukprot:TRINITY_DN9748_c0_g1_i1.p2 TRINITY_DN9748_c0_g1~~TRINITY_DN9748_c0_g1_i1.p2  ORF type:complete len:117 (+),score=27.05 TRINITY_DN9748_c0_g1_i1:625-975(+)
MIYTREAHATDIWKLGDFTDIRNHQSIDDRYKASLQIKDKGLNIPLLLDSMNDNFDKMYSSWPERYYILDQGKFYYISQPTTNFGFDFISLSTNVNNLRISLRQQEITVEESGSTS